MRELKMRTLIVAVLSVVMAGVCAPVAGAVEYDQDGRVVAEGYDGPGWDTKDLSKVAGLATAFSLMAIADFPLGKVPTLGMVAAGGLVIGAMRKERIDAERNVPSATVAKALRAEPVYGMVKYLKVN